MRVFIVYLVLILGLSLSVIGSSLADERSLDVEFPATRGLGLIFSGSEVFLTGASKIESTTEGSSKVTFDFEGLRSNDLITFIANGDAGQTKITPLKRLNDTVFSAKLCKEQELPPALQSLGSNLALLKSLREIRVARRDVARLKIKELTAAGLLEKLAALEDRLNLAPGKEPLTLELSPFELLERLSKLSRVTQTK